MSRLKFAGLESAPLAIVARGDPALRHLLNPMSTSARALLAESLLQLGRISSGRFQVPQVIREFAKDYDPILYEEAALRYTTDSLVARIRAMGRLREMDAILARLRLVDVLADDSSLDAAPSISKSLSPEAREVYGLLTTSFLTGDFTPGQLQTMISLARENPVDAIRAAMAKVDDVTKRTIPYLAAVVKSDRERADAGMGWMRRAYDRTSRVLADLEKLHGGGHFRPPADALSRWRDRVSEARAMRIAAEDVRRERESELEQTHQ